MKEYDMKIFHSLLLSLVVLFLSVPFISSDDLNKTSDEIEKYIGEYKLPSGEWVTIGKMGPTVETARILYFNWESGRFGRIKPLENNRFCVQAWETPDTSCKIELKHLYNKSGRPVALLIAEKDGKENYAEPFEPYDEQEVTFPNGDVTLSGTLRIPKGANPAAAIVLIHGSGPGTRTQLSIISSFFSRLGMAVLTYDKRGCGSSTGDWKKVDLDVLADDALAGALWLKTQSGLKIDHVGLWGISQGGWIGPLAAAKSDEVSFVINSSGPGTSLRRQDTFMMANVLKASGFSQEEIDFVIATLNTLYDYGRGKIKAEALEAAMEKAKANPKMGDLVMSVKDVTPENLYKGQAIGDPAWFFHMNPDNDGAAPYRKIHCPLLVTYGKLDYTVPVDESVEMISKALKESGNKDYMIKVIDTAGHGFARMQESNPMAQTEPYEFVRDYFSTQENWLRLHGFIK
jgi:pimeloyl-ACP methyl ester carboxylesterase